MQKPIQIYGAPKFLVPFTLKEVQDLRDLSNQHYDFACRAAGVPGGFISRWVNQLNFAPASLEEERDGLAVSATWRELDTVLKICELIHTPPELVQLAHRIHAAMGLASALSTTWQGTSP